VEKHFPSDPNVRKEWMNYFLMKFQIASVRNNETVDVGISERLKLKDIDAVLIILDLTVM